MLLPLIACTALGEEPSDPAMRGAAVFQQYCVLCHGDAGHGDGRAAGLQKVRPSDLTRSKRSDAYKVRIITKGGAALDRSVSMPSWAQVLSEREIQDLVVFLRTLTRPAVVKKAAPAQVIGLDKS
jgi:mono/diheme cytochrome c family protein